MKTSIFAVAAALLYAVFVVATPTTPNTLEPRCEECDEACPSTHFYYHPRKCCLQNGGPPWTPSPPPYKSCPKWWYWNGDKKCCTPRYPQPINNPPPSCQSSTYPMWDNGQHCCRSPPTGSGPPPSHHSPYYKRNPHQPKSKYTARKPEAKKRQADMCRTGLTACPVPGVPGEFECVDPLQDIFACGGCPASQDGQNCQDIPNSVNVACQDVQGRGTCIVNSCLKGYVPSNDGRSCRAV